MATNNEETAGLRRATQSCLAENRAEMESIIIESTDRLMEHMRVTAHEAYDWQTRTVELQREFMELLKQYMEAGGTVLAAPIYRADAIRASGPAIRPSRIHLFTEFKQRFKPGHVPLHLQHLLDHTADGLWVEALAVQNQDGDKIQLNRITGESSPYREDVEIWKWLFCELGEGEDLNTVVTDRERWGWGGKFTWGTPLEMGEQWGHGRVLGGDEENIVVLM
ncbi:hypothetical protein OCU04_007597 [Sclerotinia nivalis]|uniref:Uncharacterized protein n=1 Tax=Sclerotinia nivalis TaxID=352851 RepID=A0A9X0AJ40_9HELO|nr:hypothetical protein OCU04_007597 [Sclerotinia nivalis]